MATTEEQRKEIKRLYNEGLSFAEISRKMGIHQGLVGYWAKNREKVIKQAAERFSKLSPEEKRAVYEKQKEYFSHYFKERYHTDPVFREKVKERCRNWNRKHYVKKKNQK